MKVLRVLAAVSVAAALPLVAPDAAHAAAATTSTVVYNVGCWTTVTSTTQYYANCSPEPVSVCPGYVLGSEKKMWILDQDILDSYTGLADDSDTAVWQLKYYPIPSGARRTTFFC